MSNIFNSLQNAIKNTCLFDHSFTIKDEDISKYKEIIRNFTDFTPNSVASLSIEVTNDSHNSIIFKLNKFSPVELYNFGVYMGKHMQTETNQ